MSALRGKHLGTTRPLVPAPLAQAEVKPIFKHVQQFETSARIKLLAVLLEYEERFLVLSRKYPVEITGDDYRAVVYHHDNDGFTVEGWIEALWESL